MYRTEQSLKRGLALLPIWMLRLREQTSSLQRLPSNGEVAKMTTHAQGKKVRWKTAEPKMAAPFLCFAAIQRIKRKQNPADLAPQGGFTQF